MMKLRMDSHAIFLLWLILWSTFFLCTKTVQGQKIIKVEETIKADVDDKVSLKNIVDDLVQAHIKNNPKGALVVGLLNDTAKAVISYGQLSHHNEQKPDKHSLFEIGSVTKPFTALLVLILEQQGKLDLEEPISTYLPDSLNNPYLQQIKIIDLIAHQSGLPKTPVNLNVTKTNPDNPYEHYTNTHLLEYLQVFKPLKSSKKIKAKRKQKKSFRYSDTGFGVLGLILETVSGQPYAELLNHYIFTPLQISNTCLQTNNQQKQQLSSPYTFNQLPTANYSYQSSMQASSGLYSCVDDLLTFVAAQMPLSSNLQAQNLYSLSQKSHEALAKSNMKGIDISSGWYKLNRGRKYPPIYVSNGGTGGYFTYIAFNKQSLTGVVLLSNSSVRIDQIGNELLSVLNQKSEY